MKTQKVRIKVLIDSAGNYCGYGYKDAHAKDIDETLYDVVDGPNMTAHWITVDIPIPEITISEVTMTI